VCALVDSGASHCYVSERAFKKLLSNTDTPIHLLAISDMKVPENVKELRSFLGFSGVL
jgi:hypothetical protein